MESAAAIKALFLYRVNEGIQDAVHLFRGGALNHKTKVPIGLC